MSLKSSINHIRRKLMHGLTTHVRFPNTKIKAGKKIEIKRVLLCRPNSRLGNQLLVTPLVQDITALFPGCKIDLFVRGSLSEIVFENYGNVDSIIQLPKKPFDEFIKYIKVWLSLRKQSYDLAINTTEGSFSGSLSVRFTRSKLRFYNQPNAILAARYPDYKHIAKFPVYNFRHYISPLCVKTPESFVVPTLNIKLRPAELADGKKILDSYVDNGRKTICIYTFATGVKCYSESWWATVYDRLKKAYGQAYNILEVLPIENISRIHFEAPSYYSKDIREIASVIAHSVLFLGADSGIMHLAVSSGTPTVGLFSVTDISIYHPYGNHSIAIDTRTTDADGIIAAMDTILNETGS